MYQEVSTLTGGDQYDRIRKMVWCECRQTFKCISDYQRMSNILHSISVACHFSWNFSVFVRLDVNIHNNSDQSEVELVTLVNEQLPKYTLRVDSVVGYTQEDWLQTPCLPVEFDADLSPQHCAEILKLFLLSGDRLSQMTRTYHDVKAVTDLLGEKEKDLELAARIGQTLLSKNQDLSQQKDVLEEKLAEALEEASQLRYEINQKETLLHIYTDDDALSTHSPSPTKDLRFYGKHSGQAHVDVLQDKIKRLEEHNSLLIQEQEDLQAQAENLDAKESSLISDTVKQLGSLQDDLRVANEQIADVTEELNRRNDDAIKQREEIDELVSHIINLQRKYKNLTCEHEALQQDLNTASTSQVELANLVQCLESRYNEVLSILDETRKETRKLAESSMLSSEDSIQMANNGRIPFHHSLAAEIENSDADLEICEAFPEEAEEKEKEDAKNRSRKSQARILETVKIANKVKGSGTAQAKRSKSCGRVRSEANGDRISGRKTSPLLFFQGSSTKALSIGKPGVPGTDDLDDAIKSLSIAEVKSRHLQKQMQAAVKDAACHLPHGGGVTKRCQSAPKLRIVKPLEGSATLQQWKYLAENHLPFVDLDRDVTSSAGIIIRSRAVRAAKHQLSTSQPHRSSLPHSTSAGSTASASSSFDDEGITFTAHRSDDLHHSSAAAHPHTYSTKSKKDNNESNCRGIAGLKAYSCRETMKSSAGLCNAILYKVDSNPMTSPSVLPKTAQSSPNLYGLVAKDLSVAPTKESSDSRSADVSEDWEFLHGSPCLPSNRDFSFSAPPEQSDKRGSNTTAHQSTSTPTEGRRPVKRLITKR